MTVCAEDPKNFSFAPNMRSTIHTTCAYLLSPQPLLNCRQEAMYSATFRVVPVHETLIAEVIQGHRSFVRLTLERGPKVPVARTPQQQLTPPFNQARDMQHASVVL